MTRERYRLVERLAHAIANERFRARFGPGWDVDAAQCANAVIEELGLEMVEFSQIYPACEPAAKIEPAVERAVRSSVANFISKETPMAIEIERGREDRFPGESRMTGRCWVVTRPGLRS